MQRFNLPAVMYVVAGAITAEGVPVNWITGLDPAKAPPLLTADEVRELHDRGWEIGSHSMAHRDLPTLSEAECLADLRESRELLSDLIGADVTTLAYPFGRHSAHVRRAAERAGYDLAFALPEGPEVGGRFAVPRTGIYRGNRPWTFRAKINPLYSSVRTSVPYQWVRAGGARLRAVRR